MKYIKNINEYSKDFDSVLPGVGDYVICNSNFKSKELANYINSTVGKIYKIYYNSDYPYSIIYDIPKNYENNISFIKSINAFKNYKNELEIRTKYGEIKYWSKNKEELIIILQTKKYNL